MFQMEQKKYFIILFNFCFNLYLTPSFKKCFEGSIIFKDIFGVYFNLKMNKNGFFWKWPNRSNWNIWPKNMNLWVSNSLYLNFENIWLIYKVRRIFQRSWGNKNFYRFWNPFPPEVECSKMWDGQSIPFWSSIFIMHSLDFYQLRGFLGPHSERFCPTPYVHKQTLYSLVPLGMII